MKIRKWTILLGLALTVFFTLVLPTVLTNKEAAMTVAYEKKKEATIVEFKNELILAVAAVSADESQNPLEVAVATELVEDEETPLGASVTVSSNEEVKDNWVQSKIDENTDRISEGDLNRGSEIYNSLDTHYIFGLADGGLTPLERTEVDVYLKSQLSSSDYELAKSLYFKYVGLLNE